MKSLLATRAIRSTVVYPAADSEFLGLACSRDYWTRRDGVLYFGTIRDEIDVELLARLSDAGVQVTVVGPSAIESTAEYLRSHSVSVWPGVAIDELPELVSQFKVTILPYRGDRIGTLLPAKYWNCLVSGAWVVASTLGLYGLTEGNVRSFADSRGITADFINNLFESAPPRPVTIPDWTTRWQEFKEAAMVEAN
jgi:hypothetical protein